MTKRAAEDPSEIWTDGELKTVRLRLYCTCMVDRKDPDGDLTDPERDWYPREYILMTPSEVEEWKKQHEGHERFPAHKEEL